jgi:hypothetical protein
LLLSRLRRRGRALAIGHERGPCGVGSGGEARALGVCFAAQPPLLLREGAALRLGALAAADE